MFRNYVFLLVINVAVLAGIEGRRRENLNNANSDL